LIEGKTHGRRILLPVAVFASRNAADLTFETYTGLLDTGATASWVSSAIVRRFDLRPVAKKQVVVATEIRIRPTYLFRLGLIGDDQPKTAIPIVFAETMGFEISQAEGFDVLLGMDVILQTDFELKRDGSWELRFG
jgi:hypothetical protein